MLPTAPEGMLLSHELQEAVAILAALEAALRPAQVAQRAAYRLVYAARAA